MLYLKGILGLQAWWAASQVTLRELFQEAGEGVGYLEVFQQGIGRLNIKRLLLIKENQRFQIKELTVSLCLGRCKSLASLKSFFSYVSQLSWSSSLSFSHPELLWGSLSGVTAV